MAYKSAAFGGAAAYDLPDFQTGKTIKVGDCRRIVALQIVIAGSKLPQPRWLSKDEITQLQPNLKADGLIGGYRFYDGQMDDYALGMWVAELCRKLGVVIRENVVAEKVDRNGNWLTQNGQTYSFDRVVNVAGPWAEELLQQSGMSSPVKLDLVRGSHLIVNRYCGQAYLLEVPGELRIFFVLPWKGKTLIGTTDVRQELNEPIVCSKHEIAICSARITTGCLTPLAKRMWLVRLPA